MYKNSKNKINITVITKFFPPDKAATGQLIYDLTNRLNMRRINTLILTGMPFYSVKDIDAKKLEKYKNSIIKRTRLSKTFKNNLIGRFVNQILYSLKVFFLLFNKKNRNDLLLITTEPPMLQNFVYFISKIFKTKYILIIYDLYPDALIKANILSKENLFIKFWNLLNKYSYDRSSHIVVLSNQLKKIIGKRLSNKDQDQKISVINSWADINRIQPLDKQKNSFVKKYNLVGKFVVLYSGNMGRFHDLETLIKSSNHLKEHKDIVFLMIGGGYQFDKLKELKLKLKLENITFLPFQDYSVIPESLTSADIAIVSISKNSEEIITPSKMYGHLAAGTPIALISPKEFDLRGQIMKNKCGECFINGDYKSLSEWIIFLKNNKKVHNNFSKESRRLAEKISNPDKIALKYYKIIHNLM